VRQAACWQVIVLALGFAGCTRQAPAPAVKPAVGFESIRLSRSACHGRCPVYSVEIGKDGKGRFAGEEYVKAKGAHDLQLRRDDIALLSAVLQRTAFWTLKDSYQSEADGCTSVFTDMPYITISVTSEGKTRSVTLYQGCDGAAIPSDALGWLANTIDYLANTRPLVDDPDLYK
jgi:hypothetical protein